MKHAQIEGCQWMITHLRSLRGLQADLPLACLTGWHRIPDQLHLHHCFLGSIAEAVYLECSILHEIKTEKKRCTRPEAMWMYIWSNVLLLYLKTSDGFLASFDPLPLWFKLWLAAVDQAGVQQICFSWMNLLWHPLGPSCFLLDKTEMI